MQEDSVSQSPSPEDVPAVPEVLPTANPSAQQPLAVPTQEGAGVPLLYPTAQLPTDADVSGAKNAALLPVLQAFAEEVEKRIGDGQLKKELGEMRTTQILFHLGKLAQALKGPAVQVGIRITPNDQDKIRAFSPRRMTDRERVVLHNRMDKERNG